MVPVRVPLREVDRTDALVTLCGRLPSGGAVSLRYVSGPGALLRVDGKSAGAFDREHRVAVLPASEREREVTLEVERWSLPTNGLPSGPGFSWWLFNARAHPAPAMYVDVGDADDVAGRSFDSARSAGSAQDDKLRAGYAQDDKQRAGSAQDDMLRAGSAQDDKLGAGSAWDDARKGGVADGGDDTYERVEERDIVLWGHSHLDVAWLWTFAQTHRKAQRTFAIALDLLERDAGFVFMQSQPQLYRFVQERDPALLERVRDLAAQGRFDADVAALWVESDCNIPSGESLIRQMLHAHAWCTRELGVTPGIAWLPDSFGFANTLPTLLAHCGIERFATTKLQWNDTTRFPYPQFRWRGPDGGVVLAALIDSYDGGFSAHRVAVARHRDEPIVAGYGDGGGGVTFEMLHQAPGIGVWQRPRAWFDTLAENAVHLPAHTGELYLQYHRGVYTTHHDLKAANARLERALNDAEELVAWCVAVHAPQAMTSELCRRLEAAWEIVLRNQFHDVLPGTSIAAVNEGAREEYARAESIVDGVTMAARAALPRAAALREHVLHEPVRDRDGWLLNNELLRVRVLDTGAVVECSARGRPNVVTRANLLALYRDAPQKWEAWNIDAGYERSRKAARPGAPRAVDGGLEIPFDLGGSHATMRVTLRNGERFVRVDLVVNWRERRRLLRVENWLPISTDHVTYGSPHGIVERSSHRDTPEERAAFEVPGQRFAYARDANGNGLALLALDTYGWSARALPRGGIALGHSLLRGTTWPDARADVGEHRLQWAFAPLSDVRVSAVEEAWERFAHDNRVRLFTTGEEGVRVVACKPAHDGDGVILRLRECDGRGREARARCGARMRDAVEVDGLERALPHDHGRIEGEALIAPLRAFGLATYRVRF